MAAAPSPASDGPTITGEEAVRRNVRVARASVATAVTLGLVKLVAAVLTGSLSIVASLVDSAMDVFASTVNYLAIRFAGRPADADHAYGHGKAEALAGLVQTVFVGFSGVYLLVEGVRRVIQNVHIERTSVGIAVMAVSTVASAWITWLLRSTARKTGSVALAADSLHYASDVGTNLGVLGALLAIRLTGAQWLDGLVAVVVAFVVLGTAVRVLRRSASELMDTSLSDAEVEDILGAVRLRVPQVRGLHDIRTRRAGPTVFVDCHVELPRELPFVEAHRLTERVRDTIERARPGALVTIHADPFPLRPDDLDPGVDDGRPGAPTP